MSRPLLIAGVVIGIVILISAGYLYDAASRVQTAAEPEANPAFVEEGDPLYDAADPPVEVRLFFPTPSSDLPLRSRDMTIFGSPRPENRVRQIIEHLIAGPGDPLLYGTLPGGTRLTQVFLAGDGTAYLDFNSALSDNHPGGILLEQSTLYSISNSLVYNLDEVERVKILVGGVERETLAGPVMLLLPFGLDLSLTDIATDEQG